MSTLADYLVSRHCCFVLNFVISPSRLTKTLPLFLAPLSSFSSFASTLLISRLFHTTYCSHTAFFAAYRGNGGDTIGWTGMIAPLAVTAVPTIAYSAYTRAAPPAFLSMSLASCVLLHAYDRVWHPKGLHTENMPLARLNRRVF